MADVRTFRHSGSNDRRRDTVFVAGEDILAGQILYVSSIDSSEAPVCHLAHTGVAGWRFLVVALHDVTAGDYGTCDPVVLLQFDTSALAVGDPIYLSATPGAISTTPVLNGDGAAFKIGNVANVAVAGRIIINTHATLAYKSPILTTDGYLGSSGGGGGGTGNNYFPGGWG